MPGNYTHQELSMWNTDAWESQLIFVLQLLEKHYSMKAPQVLMPRWRFQSYIT